MSSLPVPPLRFYLPPPSEPVWRNERQSQHVASLHSYISEMFVWTEQCRNQMLFLQKSVGHPVASTKEWDDFLAASLTVIREWIETLKQWTDSEMR